MSEQTLFLGYMEKDVPATQDEYQKGVFLSWLSYHWRGKETGEFQKQYGRFINTGSLTIYLVFFELLLRKSVSLLLSFSNSV